jgi:hypothetical protein
MTPIKLSALLLFGSVMGCASHAPVGPPAEEEGALWVPWNTSDPCSQAPVGMTGMLLWVDDDHGTKGVLDPEVRVIAVRDGAIALSSDAPLPAGSKAVPVLMKDGRAPGCTPDCVIPEN